MRPRETFPVAAHGSAPDSVASVPAAWASAVGPMLALVCDLVSIDGAVATVASHSALWDDSLRMMAPRIIDRLRARGLDVCWIRFVDGDHAWVEA